jgi:hypothetical protein
MGGSYHCAHIARGALYAPPAIIASPRIAGIADFQLPIDPSVDGLMDIGRSCHTTFSIFHRQSAIGNENSARAPLPIPQAPNELMKSLANPYAFFMSCRACCKFEAQMNGGLRVEVGLVARLYQPGAVADVPAATDGQPELEIFVIFTDHPGTLAALRTAHHLGDKLDARLRLLMLYEVPYALPLTRPAIPAGFLEEQLRTQASKIPVAIAAHVYLCRDKRPTCG